METSPKQRCGARTRRGTACRRWPIKGKHRCRLHGGKSSGAPPAALMGNNNATKHGSYAKAILPHERPLVPQIRALAGTLDEELVLLRLQLRRTVVAQSQYERLQCVLENDLASGRPSPKATLAFPMVAVEENESQGAPTQRCTRRRLVDFTDRICRLVGAILRVERTRHELLRTGASDTVEEFARDLEEFMSQASATVPGGRFE